MKRAERLGFESHFDNQLYSISTFNLLLYHFATLFCLLVLHAGLRLMESGRIKYWCMLADSDGLCGEPPTARRA